MLSLLPLLLAAGPTQVVRTHADLMLEHGRDRYGEVHSPLFVAVLDARTRECPAQPEPFEALIGLEV